MSTSQSVHVATSEHLRQPKINVGQSLHTCSSKVHPSKQMHFPSALGVGLKLSWGLQASQVLTSIQVSQSRSLSEHRTQVLLSFT